MIYRTRMTLIELICADFCFKKFNKCLSAKSAIGIP
jgi:hypothetical protein